MSEHDGSLVIFKSVPDFWRREYDGRKPNTVRIVDIDDDRKYDTLVRAQKALQNGEPASIEVINTADGRTFFRRLTDISIAGHLLGKALIVLSWMHEDGQGTYRDPECDEGAA